MKPGLLCCMMLVIGIDAFAHRLDEYLQATRISVAAQRIDLSIDLTPGVAIADQLLPIIDTNHDHHVSELEVAAYAKCVLREIRIELNEKGLALSVVDVSFPSLPDVKHGLGVIRIKATAPVERLAAGSHTLTLTNAHLPAISVYLVNALVPKDATIRITKQTRDELQTTYRLNFELAPADPHPTSRIGETSDQFHLITNDLHKSASRG